jgi:hypothetical protein
VIVRLKPALSRREVQALAGTAMTKLDTALRSPKRKKDQYLPRAVSRSGDLCLVDTRFE